MRVISRRALREFWAAHSDALSPLSNWYSVMKSSRFKTPAELKAVFSSADFVDDLTVFNIGGNKYRLIAFIDYRAQIAYVKHVLTHAQYDQGKWRK